MTDQAEGAARSFDARLAWRLDPQVALRDEAFGALAYHYGTRRLVFLKSRHLVDVVRGLDSASSAAAAIAAVVDVSEVTTYEAALSRLADSEIIHAA